jgi:hypothetical protein
MPKPSGDEWEYLVEHRQVTVDDLLAKDVPGHTQAYLNDHGDEGWELVQVLLDDSGRGLGACPGILVKGTGAVFIFKRPKK